MEVLLLGTGAAEGIPAFYSGSRVSDYARKHGGRDVRTRSGALIDGGLKIDLPPDTLMQMHREGLDARDWSALLFTHADEDHFAVNEMQYAMHPFSDMDYVGFTIYGNDRICEALNQQYPGWPMELVQTKSFEPFNHAEYTITPISARHNDVEDCQNHVVERNGKALLYATDTGIWHDETWEFLTRFKLDGLVIECTLGFSDDGYAGHLSLSECLFVVDRLRMDGILRPDAKVVSTHHSHNGDATYGELVDALAPHGVEAGFDGMRFEV